MSDADLCYNKVNGCTKLRGSDKYIAFCSKTCWREFNSMPENIPMAGPRKYNTLQKIHVRLMEMKEESLKDNSAVKTRNSNVENFMKAGIHVDLETKE